MKKLLLLAFVVITAIISCRKDDLTTNTNTDPFPVPTEYVKSSIAGTIIDENDRAVPDAIVTLKTSGADAITRTDQNGCFRFTDQTINAKGAYVKVEKSGYFHGSRTINVRLNTQNTVRIQLLSNAFTRTINATTGGTADYTDYSVTLPANAVVVEATNALYSGEVRVAAKFLDPTDPDFALQMPGRLQGVTIDEQLIGLRSMGMLAVELKSNTGEKLQIKAGSKATISSVVPAAILAKAPATIPLWYFDEAQGLWIEEGQSTLTNGRYTGEVSHFSFWNHDYKDPLVEIDFCVVDQDGNPVPNAQVRTRLQSTGQYGWGFTDNTGHILGLVPQNEQLIGEVFLNPSASCATNPLVSQPIGPFASNGSYCFTIQVPQFASYTITGTLTNCDGNPVTNGYVRIDGRQDIYPVNGNGEYNITLIDCAPISSIVLFGYDMDNAKESNSTTVTLTPGANAVPPIQVCNTLQEYLICTTPLGTYTNPEVQISVSPDSSGGYFVSLYSSPLATAFYIQMPTTPTIGSYTPSNMWIEGQMAGAVLVYTCQGATGTQSCSGMTINITEYDPTGYVGGNFSGILYGNQGTTPVTISGSFRGKL